MRHHKKNRVLGREAGLRKALLRSLASSLILHGKIETTEAKAKELRPFIEKLITKGKNDTLSSRRLLIARLGSVRLVSKVISDISTKHKTRQGGYTRITKMGRRASDGAKLAQIEFV
ncbi:MAG TPA: 50S ribosomal protein L17 [Candidatus Paceibacterota bacterium]